MSVRDRNSCFSLIQTGPLCSPFPANPGPSGLPLTPAEMTAKFRKENLAHEEKYGTRFILLMPSSPRAQSQTQDL